MKNLELAENQTEILYHLRQLDNDWLDDLLKIDFSALLLTLLP